MWTTDYGRLKQHFSGCKNLQQTTASTVSQPLPDWVGATSWNSSLWCHHVSEGMFMTLFTTSYPALTRWRAMFSCCFWSTSSGHQTNYIFRDFHFGFNSTTSGDVLPSHVFLLFTMLSKLPHTPVFKPELNCFKLPFIQFPHLSLDQKKQNN